MDKIEEIKKQLEYLRGELRKECISYGELAELQTLADHIEPGDVELLEPAGIPEHENNQMTEVIFRIWKDGTIDAVFPYDIADLKGNITIYTHIGQHCSGDYYGCIERTKLAKPEQFADLKKELESYPYNYNLKVVKRRNYKRYLSEYYKIK